MEFGFLVNAGQPKAVFGCSNSSTRVQSALVKTENALHGEMICDYEYRV